jgi:dienelactone hydrolase
MSVAGAINTDAMRALPFMSNRNAHWAALLSMLLCASLLCFGQASPLGAGVANGVVLEKVVTLADPQQSYALYVPSYYAPSRSWPIIYAFDPDARGKLPVESLKIAAEKYGYIVAGSNNARNGPIGPESEAAQAMWNDTHKRFKINEARIYATGFSGGARLATAIAVKCKCMAGVFAHGAGFEQNASPEPSNNAFLYFGTIGDEDFNYPEMVRLADQLDKAGFTSRIRRFSGPHQWAPPEIWLEGIEWFELHAMKKKLRPVDTEFVSRQFARAVAAAKQAEDSGDILAARYAYAKLAQDFDGLRDVESFTAKANTLGESKAYNDAEKRESNELKKQDSLTAEVARSFVAFHQNPDERQTTALQLRQQLAQLRNKAEKEETGSKTTKRARSQVAAMIFETADSDLRHREFSMALMQFELLKELRPSSPRPYIQLARTYALSGDKKRGIANLRQAQEHGFKDFAQLADDPDFASLRDEAEFKKLLDENSHGDPQRK